MSVSTLHPCYIKVAPRYKLIRDIINNDAMCHLRNPEPDDPYSQRNIQYKKDGVLTNFTNLTREGLTGLIFRKKLKLSLPEELNYLIDDITGTGINIYQFSQHTASELIQLGRYGLLVDFYNEGGKAYIKPYCAESILNWKTRVINGVTKLSLLTLREYVPVITDDVFCQDTQVQYRVLMLDNNNQYVQYIFNEDEELIESYEITDYKGSRLLDIPFVFLGSENNDWEVDKQPLYDLAVLNRGHYSNSCDYEESIFICGQPYLTVDPGECSREEFEEANPNGIAYGSRKALVLGAGGNATLLQANEKQLPAQAMREKLDEAAKIGARLIEPSGGRETAEAARIRYGAQHSALYTLTSNMTWGVIKALKLVCLFMGANPEQVNYVLNKDFYEDTADPNVIAQQIMLLEKGVVSKEEIRDYELKTGVLKEEDSANP
jgi:hypothetical protein